MRYELVQVKDHWHINDLARGDQVCDGDLETWGHAEAVLRSLNLAHERSGADELAAALKWIKDNCDFDAEKAARAALARYEQETKP